MEQTQRACLWSLVTAAGWLNGVFNIKANSQLGKELSSWFYLRNTKNADTEEEKEIVQHCIEASLWVYVIYKLPISCIFSKLCLGTSLAELVLFSQCVQKLLLLVNQLLLLVYWLRLLVLKLLLLLLKLLLLVHKLLTQISSLVLPQFN